MSIASMSRIGASSPIVAGSLTPWVDHPVELNAFAPAVNAIRYAIVFDGTINNDGGANDSPGVVLYGAVKGVTTLTVKAVQL